MIVGFARRAETDLQEIAQYTREEFGAAQADRYLAQLQSAMETLAAHPQLGKRCDEVRPGLRRLEQGSHVIFYAQQDESILISRVLHKRMLPNLDRFHA